VPDTAAPGRANSRTVDVDSSTTNRLLEAARKAMPSASAPTAAVSEPVTAAEPTRPVVPSMAIESVQIAALPSSPTAW